jgi:maltose O-acetyltransferase
MFRHLFNIILSLLPPSKFFSIRRRILIAARVDAAEGVCYCGGGWIYGRGKLVLGHKTWISPRCIFYTNQDCSINIGDHCDIGPGVEFVTGSHNIAGSARRAGVGFAEDILVGDGVWVGAGSLILGGVSIGAGSVIAAGAVVTRDIPPNSLAGGIPCKVIRVLD